MAPENTKDIDLMELLRDGRHFAERRENHIHVVDSLTGHTIALLGPSPQETPSTFSAIELPNGRTVYVQQGINTNVPTREITYSPLIIDLLCQKIAEGGSLTELCRQREYPSYSTLRRWARQHTWIDEALQQARRDRAEYFRDKAVHTAEGAEGRDPISVANLQVDTYKWAAGVDDGKYSPKAKIEASINLPTQIIVKTGIDRTPLPAPQEPIDVTPEASVKDDEETDE
jgi:hypothetical protein